MRPAKSKEEFLRAPVGKWYATGPSLMWCASPDLCGSVGWGRPTPDDTRRVLECFGGWHALGPQFDVILDGSAIDAIHPESLTMLFAWVAEHQATLGPRVRRRVGVIPGGAAGITMSGITLALRAHRPSQPDRPMPLVLAEAREGFRALRSDGDALCDEVEALVRAARNVAPLVLALRTLLAACDGNTNISDAARRLGLSARTLQRDLQTHGTSFRDEQIDARFRAAGEMLVAGEKVAAVAARLGLTETGLAVLIRGRAGCSPSELRAQLQKTPALISTRRGS